MPATGRKKNTLWPDDLYKGVPVISERGKLTGDTKYFDEAVRQVLQFSERLFNKNLGTYMHGLVEGMACTLSFIGAGSMDVCFLKWPTCWMFCQKTILAARLCWQSFRGHAKGVASFQPGEGFWHQLLNRNDSYLETSCTARDTYAIARGISNGRLDIPA